MQELTRDALPPPLASPRFKGQAYRLVDLVLDVPSLVQALAEQHRDAIFSVDWNHAALAVEDRLAYLRSPQLELRPRQLLLTAGAGNEALVQALLAKEPTDRPTAAAVAEALS